MSAGVRTTYYSNYPGYANRPLTPPPVRYQPTVSLYPSTQATGQYPANSGYGRPTVYTSPGYSAYQPHLLSIIKQQLGGMVVNTSRQPITLQQLKGKRDGDAVNAASYPSLPHTGVTTVDGALQRTGDLVGYVPKALGNAVSSSLRGAVYSGAGATVLSIAGMVAGKLLGRMKGYSGLLMAGIAAGLGLFGALLGGTFGFVKSIFQTIRDIKDIILGNR